MFTQKGKRKKGDLEERREAFLPGGVHRRGLGKMDRMKKL